LTKTARFLVGTSIPEVDFDVGE
nr:CPD-I=serine carboxypeptidase {N-terminal} [Aspergillus niger, Peptide Partial, 22 aa] [Aspergillus niger]